MGFLSAGRCTRVLAERGARTTGAVEQAQGAISEAEARPRNTRIGCAAPAPRSSRPATPAEAVDRRARTALRGAHSDRQKGLVRPTAEIEKASPTRAARSRRQRRAQRADPPCRPARGHFRRPHNELWLIRKSTSRACASPHALAWFRFRSASCRAPARSRSGRARPRHNRPRRTSRREDENDAYRKSAYRRQKLGGMLGLNTTRPPPPLKSSTSSCSPVAVGLGLAKPCRRPSAIATRRSRSTWSTPAQRTEEAQHPAQQR